jgi:hypothetical protein
MATEAVSIPSSILFKRQFRYAQGLLHQLLLKILDGLRLGPLDCFNCVPTYSANAFDFPIGNLFPGFGKEFHYLPVGFRPDDPQ